jgi:hypothetical protein
MLEVTENCYHLMALWAELSQTTLHAPRNKSPFLGIASGDFQGLGSAQTANSQGGTTVFNCHMVWP